MVTFDVGLVHTVVSISACGAEHPGSIPGLDISGLTFMYGFVIRILYYEYLSHIIMLFFI